MACLRLTRFDWFICHQSSALASKPFSFTSIKRPPQKKTMSLYYDAAPFLLPNSDQAGSLKSRIFNSKSHKSSPKQIFALVSETSKWSPVLSEVIERSQLLQLERKVRPSNPSPAGKLLTDLGGTCPVAVSEHRSFTRSRPPTYQAWSLCSVIASPSTRC